MYSNVNVKKLAITCQVLRIIIAGFMITLLCNQAIAGRFTSKYPCRDAVKTCVSSGEKVVDGFKIHKDCWEWSYTKTCDYPSKDDCGPYNKCYLVGYRDCLLKDDYGNCVNQIKEFSCKRWEASYVNKNKIRYGKEDKEGPEQLICKGLPCIDGNCVDKSFASNNEMMDSVSRLYAVSEMKGAGDPNFKLFAGYVAQCSKKAVGYSNCCSLTNKSNNWGHDLGARCTNDEKKLMEERKKNLCIYVGKENKQTMGVTTVVKHKWCCFGNMLNKVLQVEARKQLGMNFGSGGSPNCRGLTLDELLKLDFDKMDFSEFEAEIMKKMKIPRDNDLQERVRSGMKDVEKPKSERDEEARKAGINSKVLQGEVN